MFAILAFFAHASLSAGQSPTLPPYLQTAAAAFTGKLTFPSSLFAEYWPGFEPTQTTVEVQPIITDPVSGVIYPLELTNPANIPDGDFTDPYVLPPSLLTNQVTGPISATTNLSTPGSLALAARAVQSILEIITGNAINATCGKCLAALGVGKVLANSAPWEVAGAVVEICNMYGFSTYGSCAENYGITSDGDLITQVLALADVTSQDGEYICAHFIGGFCARPAPNTLDMSSYFAKLKPTNAVAPPPSGQRIRVLHLSDFHLDPRYDINSEAGCDQYLCCRYNSYAAASPNSTVLPAPRYGAYLCDTPYDLAGAAMDAIPPLAGAGPSGREFDFAIFTGDLVSHDNHDHALQLSREYVEYEESSIFSMIKSVIGESPLYSTLGNHDSWPQACNSPLTLQPEYLASQFSWNYEHISSLWAERGWIDSATQQYASVQYGGYAITTWRGLKIISFNSDFWYTDNWFNYINTSNPDISGQLRWMSDELQASEDAGQRVWILGHVPPGWDGSNAIPNPTNLFYQIVERYSPHVIAEIFFGHTHNDEFSIFYSNNGTNPSAATALATSWIGPSLTPLTNTNSGFRAYDIDPVTFNVLDSYTWISNISEAAALDNQSEHGAVYTFEYSAREAYGTNISWPASAPINATWWHLVTEQWELNPSLVEKFATYEGKSSVKTTNCTSTACVQSKICYARSGSVPISGLCAAST